MRRSRVCGAAAALVLALVGAPGEVLAGPELSGSLAADVSYSAPPGCPEQEFFEHELLLRGVRLEPSDMGAHLRVAVRRGGAGYSGRLEIAGIEPPLAAREVTGVQCSAVVQALSLSAAIALEPFLQSEDVGEGAVGGAAADIGHEAGADVEQGAKPGPLNPDGSLSTSAEGAVERPEVAPPLVVPEPTVYDGASSFWGSREPSVPWRPAVAARWVAALPVDVEGAFGAGLGVALQPASATAWSPRVEVGGQFVRTGWFGTDASARFTLLLAEFSLCAAGLGSEVFVFRPCLQLQGGVLSAGGHNISNAERVVSPWGAVGVGGELEVSVGGAWAASLRGGALRPLLPHIYQLGAEPRTVAETPPFVPMLLLGVVYRGTDRSEPRD